ncbi:MAG TPA: PQQ-dependent sugar dehydrogenase [Bacteroidales bacterium]|nr:PQQ-dependent sugar dehydrogenase [Bacteroidales bacterium]
MKIKLLLFIIPMALLVSCYGILKSAGGGQGVSIEKRFANTSDIALPSGYSIEIAAKNLTFPTGITFDDAGVPYVTESGYSYGEVFTEPKLVKINNDGTVATIASGKNGPWNGVWFQDGFFYVAEGGEMEGGRILKIDLKGSITPLIEGLPSRGDHHTNGPVVHDGYIYFGQGTATNSGIAGEDNYKFGWLKRNPDFHDIPCKDIRLAGVNYQSDNVLKEGSKESVVTGAFSSYGTKSDTGQVIRGTIPCSGSVMRIPAKGGKPELVAWGFRNPYGLAFDNKGRLYVTENGYDDRGSRPVWGAGDNLWRVEKGKWYGWPDYSAGHPLYQGILTVPGKGKPLRLLAEDPGVPPHPLASMGVHSSSNGFDFSRSKDFGFEGEAFVAQFGDMSPDVGKVEKPVGYKVVRVNVETGIINDFALNRKKNAPASKIKTGGLERPNAVRFSPDGRSMYIVDFGILLTSEKGPKPIEGTGVIWKVSKKTGR